MNEGAIARVGLQRQKKKLNFNSAGLIF